MNLEQSAAAGYAGGMRLRGILFDKDGTLLDFEATWGPLYRQLCLELGGDTARAEAMLAAGGFDAATGRFGAGSVLGAGTTFDIVRLWYPELRDDDFYAMADRIDAVFHSHGTRHSVPVEGLRETLDRLARMGFVMGVATNDAFDAAKGAVGALGLAQYLPHIFGYDSVPNPKPAADIVHAFAGEIGASPAEIAVVGDNRHDLAMARSAGAGLAVGVLTGNAGWDHLAPLADVVLPSVRELPDWLAQNRK